MQISFVSLCLLLGLTVVLAAPQKSSPGELRPGCYMSECKSLFTYDYKCPSDEFQESNMPDTSECPKGTGKFHCCREDPSGSTGSSSPSPISSSGGEGSVVVVPEAV